MSSFSELKFFSVYAQTQKYCADSFVGAGIDEDEAAGLAENQQIMA